MSAPKGPSIAVMLGGKGAPVDEESSADLSKSDAQAGAEDAAHAFADAVQAKDGKRMVRAFCALSELCGHLDELDDANEEEEESGLDEKDMNEGADEHAED